MMDLYLCFVIRLQLKLKSSTFPQGRRLPGRCRGGLSLQLRGLDWGIPGLGMCESSAVLVMG